MKSSSWKETAELIGIAAIVGSLIFVGLQMKQDREIALAGQSHDRAAAAVEFWNGHYESAFLLSVYGKPLIDIASLQKAYGPDASAEQLGVMYVHIKLVLTNLDNHHYQYESGFYDEETWSSFQEQLRSFLDTSAMARYVIANEGGQYRKSFHDLCLAILDDVRRSSAE